MQTVSLSGMITTLACAASLLLKLCAQHAGHTHLPTAKPGASLMPGSSYKSTFAVTAPDTSLWDRCVACFQPAILLAQHFLGGVQV